MPRRDGFAAEGLCRGEMVSPSLGTILVSLRPLPLSLPPTSMVSRLGFAAKQGYKSNKAAKPSFRGITCVAPRKISTPPPQNFCEGGYLGEERRSGACRALTVSDVTWPVICPVSDPVYQAGRDGSIWATCKIYKE
ncbi:hypothetical protein Bbelb_312210 [Branchiostoma belcheri]|nr:hypothetical protein Bbelb_312210 [Branchiostoma belcheri]